MLFTIITKYKLLQESVIWSLAINQWFIISLKFFSRLESVTKPLNKQFET